VIIKDSTHKINKKTKWRERPKNNSSELDILTITNLFLMKDGLSPSPFFNRDSSLKSSYRGDRIITSREGTKIVFLSGGDKGNEKYRK